MQVTASRLSHYPDTEKRLGNFLMACPREVKKCSDIRVDCHSHKQTCVHSPSCGHQLIVRGCKEFSEHQTKLGASVFFRRRQLSFVMRT